MLNIYAEIKRLEAIAAELRQQGYLQNCRLERATAGGTASGVARSQARYARLRSSKGMLLPNGAKSQYIPLEQIAETEAAIARGRELQKIEKQIVRLRATASQALTDTSAPSPEVDGFCKKLFPWLQTYMSVDTVTLLLLNTSTQDLTVRCTIGLEEEIIQQIRIPLGQGFAGSIAESKSALLVEDLSTVEVVSPVLRRRGLRSLAGMPLQFDQHQVGVLHIGTLNPRKFNDQDVQQLRLVADLLQSVIANAMPSDIHPQSHTQAIASAISPDLYPQSHAQIVPDRWRTGLYSNLKKFIHLDVQPAISILPGVPLIPRPLFDWFRHQHLAGSC